MAKFDIGVKVKGKDKRVIKELSRLDKEYEKSRDAQEFLIWDVLLGLPSGEYEIEWDVKEKNKEAK